MKKVRKLPEAELKIMMIIWENQPPVGTHIRRHRGLFYYRHIL